MEKRQATRDLTRTRILEAARELLGDDSTREVSLEGVARRADVSRLTIYYQFGSRAGLLEALFDHLANRGNMQRMAEVFQATNRSQAVEKMVRTFVGFWSTFPSAMRRLRAMAVLDDEISAGVRARDARRAHIAREILKRHQPKRLDAQEAQAAEILSMLTSFEAYDALARSGLTDEQIVATLASLAQNVFPPLGSAAPPRRSGPHRPRRKSTA
jgi:AcrR family transcriptional regulator